jgi:hypothetical protein
MLTVEEAGELLRIGRSKAYALAREWRETAGRSGLPVVDLGNVLRVPRPALEEMIGADLSTIGAAGSSEIPVLGERPNPEPDGAVTAPTTRRPRRRRTQHTDQLDLFDQAARHD